MDSVFKRRACFAEVSLLMFGMYNTGLILRCNLCTCRARSYASERTAVSYQNLHGMVYLRDGPCLHVKGVVDVGTYRISEVGPHIRERAYRRRRFGVVIQS